MLYLILKLKSIPEPVFAHVYSCPEYKCHFKEAVPNLEILYVISGNLTVNILGKTYMVKEKSFLLLPHKYPLYMEVQKDETYVHYTVSAMVDADTRLIEGMPDVLVPDEICVPFFWNPATKPKRWSFF